MHSLAKTPERSPATATERRQRWIPYLISTLIATIVLIGLVLFFGRIHGEEFSPDAFARRKFHFYQIPILRWQISPVIREANSNPLEEAISDMVELASATDASATDMSGRWDLVTSIRNTHIIHEGDAKILCDLLDLKDENDRLVLDRWADKHEAHAKVLWPVVAAAARARLYVVIPELVDRALAAASESSADADLFRRNLDAWIEQEGIRIARDFQAAGEYERATAAFEFVVSLTDSDEAREGIEDLLLVRRSSEP